MTEEEEEVLREYQLSLICPVCSDIMDCTPCVYPMKTCEKCSYKEVHWHYCSEYFIDDEIFTIDESGYGKHSYSDVLNAIAKRKTEYENSRK